METSEIFLAFGEKVQELIEAEHTPFFDFSGHVNKYQFRVYRGEWSEHVKPEIDMYMYNGQSVGEFMQACFNASNLLMHK